MGGKKKNRVTRSASLALALKNGETISSIVDIIEVKNKIGTYFKIFYCLNLFFNFDTAFDCHAAELELWKNLKDFLILPYFECLESERHQK